MRSAATAACRSEKTPAFGVPTLVTSPTANTPGYEVSSVRGLTGTHPVDGHARLEDDGRHVVCRDAEKQVVGHFGAVSEPGHLVDRIELPMSRLGYQRMSRWANASSSASDAAGDGGIGTGSGITRDISDRSRTPRAER